MKVSNFKKPFYIGAVALFATTALTVTNPVTSHADYNPKTNEYSEWSKDQYGLTYPDYINYNRNAFVKSTLPDNTKYKTIGMIDGMNNVTIDKTMKSSYYLQGYITGQSIAQGWLTYVKYGNDTSKIPVTPNAQLNNYIQASYHAYQNGIHLLINGNNYQDWVPNDDFTNRIYDYIKDKALGDANLVRTGATDKNLTPSLSKYLINKTPLGVSATDTKSLDTIKKQFHFTDIYASSDLTNIPINVSHMNDDGSTFLNNRNIDIYASSESDSAIDTTAMNATPIIVKPSASASHTKKTSIKKVTKKRAKKAAKVNKKHKIVKKRVVKKATKKRVIVKKYVSKKRVQKIRTHIPHTVYAKHRTGVHSVPQFNHGKTYYVAKGHKFHVYYKISDGHGNWRYNVGKHKFITTIPGSIGTKRVKKHVTHHKHHIVKHVLHKHHRR